MSFRRPDRIHSSRLIASTRNRFGAPGVGDETDLHEENITESLRAHDRYMTYEDSVHGDDSNELLHVSDLLADFPEQFAYLSASARLEYLLHNQDNQAFEHLEIVDYLLETHMESNSDNPNLFYRGYLIYVTAPLFMLPRNTTQLTKGQVYDTVKNVRNNLIDLIRTIDDYMSEGVVDSATTAELRGLANEIAVLMGLTYPTMLSKHGQIALPAFRWQDIESTRKHITNESNVGHRMQGFDIALYDMETTEVKQKIQTKSSQSDEFEGRYASDILVIYANYLLKNDPREASRRDLYAKIIADKTDINAKETAYRLHKALLEKLQLTTTTEAQQAS